jgi:hypothetical protein
MCSRAGLDVVAKKNNPTIALARKGQRWDPYIIFPHSSLNTYNIQTQKSFVQKL